MDFYVIRFTESGKYFRGRNILVNCIGYAKKYSERSYALKALRKSIFKGQSYELVTVQGTY